MCLDLNEDGADICDSAEMHTLADLIAYLKFHFLPPRLRPTITTDAALLGA